jgi:hypothetical protein
MRKTIGIALMCAIGGAAVAADSPTVYDRVAAKLQADSALAAVVGQPTPEIKAMAWMAGTWDVTAKVQAGAQATGAEKGTSVISYTLGGTWLEARDTYPGGTQDIGYLTFNPATRLWMALGIDSTGNAVMTTSRGWQGSRLVLEGTVMIVGEPTVLRQTVSKISDSAYDVINEEQVADGRWIVLDRYEYRKRTN